MSSLKEKTFDKIVNEPKELVVNPYIVVSKSNRTLDLFDGDLLIGRFKVGLSSVPRGDKEREGDRKTPVGEYVICTKNSASSFYLSLGLNYPNNHDALHGLRNGVISQAEYEEILYANARGLQPNWYTPLGGEICIHGGGSTKDWTVGCMALDNDDIGFLWKYTEIGTKVTITE